MTDRVHAEDSTDIAPTGRQIAISRLTGRGGSLFRANTRTGTLLELARHN